MPNLTNDPDKAIVIIGDDGEIYKLEESVWKAHVLPSGGGKGIVEQLAQFGTLLAFVGQDVAGVGIGYACTVLNLKAVLEGGKKASLTPDPGGTPTTPTT